MKIGILTLPLSNNYGGTLQNYALQVALKKLGHDSITLDYIPKRHWFPWILENMKTILLFFIPSKRRAITPTPYRWSRNKQFERFTSNHIIKTKTIREYSSSLMKAYKLDAIIVGSDQVWRPKFNRHIESSYLDFAYNYPIRKIAYAASFGVDTWEYTDQQTVACQQLAQQFDAISVREDSGIKLCEDYLHMKAVHVIDPTMLLEKSDYEELIEHVKKDETSFLAAYILDPTDKKNEIVTQKANEKNLLVRQFSMDKEAKLSVYEWLSMFRDSSFVITDSFHGVVFSIIFGKEFLCLGNGKRGQSRIDSLMRLYETGKLSELKIKSMDFLSSHLE